MDGNFLELSNISDSIMKAREYCSYLYENKFITLEMKEYIEKQCQERLKDNGCYITKPFRTCDNMSKSLYHLMKSLSRNVNK